jgi:hypothetical protein
MNMAYIDKIYGNESQWVELHKFLKKNRPEYLKHMGKRPKGEGEFPLANFPCVVDAYLLANCPLDFVQSRIKEQYGWRK